MSRLALGSTMALFTGSFSRDVAYQLTTQLHVVPEFKVNGAKTLPSIRLLDVDINSFELTHT